MRFHNFIRSTDLHNRTSGNNLPERAGMVFEQGHNLCRFIKTLQYGEKVIYLALAAEECHKYRKG